MNAPKDIIDKLGIEKFAAALELDIRNARKIRERGKIPMKHWPRLIAVAKQDGLRGVTFDRLAQLHEKAA